MGTYFRRVTYWPPLQVLARGLGLRPLLRRWYYRLARPAGGIVDVLAAGTAAQFYAETPYELRVIEGWSEKHIFERLASSLHEGDVVYDIGANIGLYSVFMAKLVGPGGQVIAVEPDSLNYRNLHKNVKLNGLANVRLFSKALGKEKARAKLYKGADTTDSTLRPGPGSADDNYEMVEIIDGDSFRVAEDLPVPRLVKIDVEGYECEVVEGLRRTLTEKRCELICCEVHTAVQGPECRKLQSLLRSFGFNRIDRDVSPGYPLFHIIAYR